MFLRTGHVSSIEQLNSSIDIFRPNMTDIEYLVSLSLPFVPEILVHSLLQLSIAALANEMLCAKPLQIHVGFPLAL